MTNIGSAFPVINKGMAFHITSILILPLLEKYVDSLYILKRKSMQVMLEIVVRYHQCYKLLSLLVWSLNRSWKKSYGWPIPYTLNVLVLKARDMNNNSISSWSPRELFRHQVPKVCSDLLITYYTVSHQVVSLEFLLSVLIYFWEIPGFTDDKFFSIIENLMGCQQELFSFTHFYTLLPILKCFSSRE